MRVEIPKEQWQIDGWLAKPDPATQELAKIIGVRSEDVTVYSDRRIVDVDVKGTLSAEQVRKIQEWAKTRLKVA